MNGPVLVLGGGGFIGSYLVNRLVDKHVQVRILDVENAPEHVPGIQFIEGNILDCEILNEAMRGCDQIYHLAAHLPIAQGNVKSSSDLMMKINVDGTRNIIALAKKNNIKRLIYTSSTAVYGVPDHNPIVNQTPISPQETYGASKVAAEELCESFAQTGGDVMVIRPCPVIGQGRLGVFQVLFEWIINGYNIPILGRGDNILDFIHVEDCADAIMALGKSPYQPRRFKAYSIGANEHVSLRQGLEKVISEVGSKSKVRSFPKAPVVWATLMACKLNLLPIAPFHALCYGESIYISNESFQQDYQWQPKHEFVSMLLDGFRWYSANRDQLLQRKSGSAHQVSPKQGILRLVQLIP